jgi:nucleoside-diphosphate-sugar epimerase
VYIDDVVDAWMRVVDDPTSHGAVLNVGSGRETSVNELADAVLAALGESRDSWELRREDMQLGDQRRSAADIGAIAAHGWKPTVSLVDGIARTAEWARTVGGPR